MLRGRVENVSKHHPDRVPVDLQAMSSLQEFWHRLRYERARNGFFLLSDHDTPYYFLVLHNISLCFDADSGLSWLDCSRRLAVTSCLLTSHLLVLLIANVLCGFCR